MNEIKPDSRFFKSGLRKLDRQRLFLGMHKESTQSELPTNDGRVPENTSAAAIASSEAVTTSGTAMSNSKTIDIDLPLATPNLPEGEVTQSSEEAAAVNATSSIEEESKLLVPEVIKPAEIKFILAFQSGKLDIDSVGADTKIQSMSPADNVKKMFEQVVKMSPAEIDKSKVLKKFNSVLNDIMIMARIQPGAAGTSTYFRSVEKSGGHIFTVKKDDLRYHTGRETLYSRTAAGFYSQIDEQLEGIAAWLLYDEVFNRPLSSSNPNAFSSLGDESNTCVVSKELQEKRNLIISRVIENLGADVYFALISKIKDEPTKTISILAKSIDLNPGVKNYDSDFPDLALALSYGLPKSLRKFLSLGSYKNGDNFSSQLEYAFTISKEGVSQKNTESVSAVGFSAAESTDNYINGLKKAYLEAGTKEEKVTALVAYAASY